MAASVTQESEAAALRRELEELRQELRRAHERLDRWESAGLSFLNGAKLPPGFWQHDYEHV